ncbi:DoxX family protein [Paenibacillus radicis (ex Xue et al. 2023)]|uniref:DoxX family protein n=1 Tax=Paenibacillus radicis (ex Xue et al. 2023) TaxID=2972489 RepID=A0ABT1YL26_9BACL|nr:DoxX family protein [Paenibacillus radicis (ex Xue et al. 2023)]MCR8633891.1 DoxX family protein [Paenibacillus radicis (ex Xue et al. 2023)]
MKKLTIGYWICTILMVALMGVGAIPDLLSVPDAVTLFAHLGYPAYLLPFLGVAKILGIIAILVPGFPRIKEWAYAGLVFDLAGAAYSTLAVGDPPIGLVFFLIGFLVIFGSYFLYHKRLKSAHLKNTK